MNVEKLIADAVAKALAGTVAKGGNGAKPVKRTKADMLKAKDTKLKASFTRRGFKDVVLMDRNDPTKPFNVRPYGRPANGDQPASGWIGQGRQVKKGETSGGTGLFHISQTEPIEVAE